MTCFSALLWIFASGAFSYGPTGGWGWVGHSPLYSRATLLTAMLCWTRWTTWSKGPQPSTQSLSAESGLPQQQSISRMLCSISCLACLFFDTFASQIVFLQQTFAARAATISATCSAGGWGGGRHTWQGKFTEAKAQGSSVVAKAMASDSLSVAL